MPLFDFGWNSPKTKNKPGPIDVNNFISDADKVYRTPEMRKFAQEQAKELLGKKPEIKHWTQGAAYLLDILAGKRYENIAGSQEYNSGEYPFGRSEEPAGTPTASLPPVAKPAAVDMAPDMPPTEKAKLEALKPPVAKPPIMPDNPMLAALDTNEVNNSPIPGIVLGEGKEKPQLGNVNNPDPLAGASPKGSWNKRLNLAYNGVPASIRANNPGASWSSPKDDRYGIEGYDIIAGNNRIGKFPTPVHGLASNMDLFASPVYAGMTLGKATSTWRGGNPGSNMTPRFEMSDGTKIGPNTVLTPELTSNPEFMTKVFKHYATHEAGRKSVPISDEQFKQAFDMFQAGGADAYNAKNSKPVDPAGRPEIAKGIQPDFTGMREENIAANMPNWGPDQNQPQPVASPNDPFAQPPMALGGPKGGPVNIGSDPERKLIQLAQAGGPQSPAAPPIADNMRVPGGGPAANIPVGPSATTPMLKEIMRNTPAELRGKVMTDWLKEQQPKSVDVNKPQIIYNPPGPSGEPPQGRYVNPAIGPTQQPGQVPTENVEGPNGPVNTPIVPGLKPGASPVAPSPEAAAEGWEKGVGDLMAKVQRAAETAKNETEINQVGRDVYKEVAKGGIEANEKIRDIEALQALQKANGGNLPFGVTAAWSTKARTAIENFTGLSFDTSSQQEIRSAYLNKMAATANHTLGERVNGKNLEAITGSNPTILNSIKGADGILQMNKQSQQLRAKFADEIGDIKPSEMRDMPKKYAEFMERNPIKVDTPEGAVYILKYGKDPMKQLRETVPPNSWIITPDGQLKKSPK